MRFLTRLSLPAALLAVVLPLAAQDAQTVLFTSVLYNTQRLSLKLTPDQAEEAARLGREAQKASAAGKFADALRFMAQGTVTMLGGEWTPEAEYAYALRGKLDHAMVAPGKVTLTLTPLFASERTANARLKAGISLARPGEPPVNLSEPVPVDPAIPFKAELTLPENAMGDYNVMVMLAPVSGAIAPGIRPGFIKAVPVHIEAALGGELTKLQGVVAKLAGNTSPALPTAEYALDLYDRADKGDVNPRAYDFGHEFAAAQQIADALTAGKDPLAGRSGDFHRAYRSKVDNTLQPYRLFIPRDYDGSKATPLVVALHGMGGDENSMFDQYGKELTMDAQKNGFLMVAPKGRGSASMYRGTAEQDVMDVLAEVRRDYKVDASRIYLMGHSMGGYGTWSVAMAHPDIFAALAPISGGGNPEGMARLKNIPQYVTHGNDDKTVDVSQSRQMVEAGKKAGAPITYVEVPGGSHSGVAQPAFAPILEFFSRQQLGKPAEGTRQ